MLTPVGLYTQQAAGKQQKPDPYCGLRMPSPIPHFKGCSELRFIWDNDDDEEEDEVAFVLLLFLLVDHSNKYSHQTPTGRITQF